MSTSAALDKDDPIMIAWEAYKATPEYANTKRWALDPAHVDGSLWSAWLAGRSEVLALKVISRQPVESSETASAECLTRDEQQNLPSPADTVTVKLEWRDNFLYYNGKHIGHTFKIGDQGAGLYFLSNISECGFADEQAARQALEAAACAWLSPLYFSPQESAPAAVSGYMQAPLEPSSIVSPHSAGVFAKPDVIQSLADAPISRATTDRMDAEGRANIQAGAEAGNFMVGVYRSGGAPDCRCGLPMSENPHPDAGKPFTLLETGPVWVCIPCESKTLHAWFVRAQKAEQVLCMIQDVTKEVVSTPVTNPPEKPSE